MRSNPQHWFGPAGSDRTLNRQESIQPQSQANNGQPESRHYRHLSLLAVMLVAVVINLALWRVANPAIVAPEASANFNGVAYNAFGRWDNPIENKFPQVDTIERDLALLSQHTRRMRTYSSSEMPQLPAIANKYGLKLTAGVWLDTRAKNNDLEISAGIRSALENRNIERLVVGNETLLHGLLTFEQLTSYLSQVRANVSVPVSTAEPWHVWLRNPKLANHVDYILVHLLPYWEGVPHEVAVDYAMRRYREVQKRFPGKHIVVGEIGWPSNGDRFKDAHASQLAQARFVREFLAKSKGTNLDYFLMEAIDQPWKHENEGRVGAYWGVLDAYRGEKFAFSGPLFSDPSWLIKALLAVALGLVAGYLLLAKLKHLRLPSKLFLATLVQGGASLTVWLLAVPLQYYLRPIDWVGLAVLVPSLILMLTIVLANGIEFAEMFWQGNLRRHSKITPLATGDAEPKVSVHLACCNEQPEMVIATIKSLVELDYRNFEAIIVDNNTKDPALWRPVEKYVKSLDERFKFFHLPQWPGYKAGALNFALEQTARDAQVVGVVDADYVVTPDWLRNLVGGFSQPEVAVVQAPQAHRDWAGQFFRRMTNWEFDGFFRIGMHHRNERNAIIQHGTMTLVRAQALRDSGNWCTDCICEDAELGLRLMQRGWQIEYVDRVYGRGLTPDSFAAFKKQRHRWAQGAMQIMRLHAADLFGLRGKRQDETLARLSNGQRYHFVAGWMSWIGDAMHLVFALAAMFWTIGILAAPHLFSLPILLFMLPVFGFFLCRMLMGPFLFFKRVDCSIGDVLGAALAGMALSHGIARGILAGLFEKHAVFQITEKAGGSSKPAVRVAGEPGKWAKLWLPVREEALLLAGLMTCVVGIALTRADNHVESAIWMALLGLQAIPYLAALVITGIAGLPEKFQSWVLGGFPSGSSSTSSSNAVALSAAAKSVSAPAAPLTARR